MSTGSYCEAFGGGGWAGYRNYLAQKDLRINEQLKERYETGEKKTDGRTRIPEYQLKAMMIKHGGEYESYDLSKVTHIIADNLAMGNKKWQYLRDRPNSRISVVTTDWIISCINCGGRIKESYFVPLAMQSRADGFGTMLKYVSSETTKLQAQALTGPVGSCASNIPSENVIEFRPSEERVLEQNDQAENLPTPQIPLGTDDSTDFVETFFRNSRLHFIGRWRERLLHRLKLTPFAALKQQSTPVSLYQKRTSKSTMMRYLQPASLPTASAQLGVEAANCEILHIDFDAFFVSVAIRKRPDLLDQPVAVSHGTNVSKSSGSEIASCNYLARQFGVTKGMWIGHAKKLCPGLKVLPYDFEGIERTSIELMDILTDVTSRVLPMSCDEAYLQLVGEIETANSVNIAFWIKERVLEQTGCRVSVGIGPNLVVAKLAGQNAKPSSIQYGHLGVYRVDKLNAMEFMKTIKLSDLPGIGDRGLEKLESSGLHCCNDVLRSSNLEKLQNVLGTKLGETVWSFCLGDDPRPIPTPQHGVGDKGHGDRTLTVSVNWGVRLTSERGIANFLTQMAQECEKRLYEADGSVGALTLKILKRAPHAPVEPIKYGGCGECIELTNHLKLPYQVSSKGELMHHLIYLWNSGPSRDCIISDVRGVTVVMAKLERIVNKMSNRQQQFSSGCTGSRSVEKSLEQQDQLSRESNDTDSLLEALAAWQPEGTRAEDVVSQVPTAAVHDNRNVSVGKEYHLHPRNSENTLSNEKSIGSHCSQNGGSHHDEEYDNDDEDNDEDNDDDNDEDGDDDSSCSNQPILSLCKSTINVSIPPSGSQSEVPRGISTTNNEDVNLPAGEISDSDKMKHEDCTENQLVMVDLATISTEKTRKRSYSEMENDCCEIIQETSPFPLIHRDKCRHVDKQAKLCHQHDVRRKGVKKISKGSAKKPIGISTSSNNDGNLLTFLRKKEEGKKSPHSAINESPNEIEVHSVQARIYNRDEEKIATAGQGLRLWRHHSILPKLNQINNRIKEDFEAEMLFLGVSMNLEFPNDFHSAPPTESPSHSKLVHPSEQSSAINGMTTDLDCSDTTEDSFVDLSVCTPVRLHLFSPNITPEEICGVGNSDCASSPRHIVDLPQIQSSQIEEDVQARFACYSNSAKLESNQLMINYNHAICLERRLHECKAFTREQQSLTKLDKPLFRLDDWIALLEKDCWLCTAGYLSKIFVIPYTQHSQHLSDFHNALFLVAFGQVLERNNSSDSSSCVHNSIARFIAETVVGLCFVFSSRRDLDIAMEMLDQLEFFWEEKCYSSSDLVSAAVWMISSLKKTIIPTDFLAQNFLQQLARCVHEFIVNYKRTFILCSF